MTDNDELHVTHAVVQNGAETKSRRRVIRDDKTWVELSFEYSALIVLRAA